MGSNWVRAVERLLWRASYTVQPSGTSVHRQPLAWRRTDVISDFTPILPDEGLCRLYYV